MCMYIRRDLAFNAFDESYHDDIEATWIERLLLKTKPIVCEVCIYHLISQIFMKCLKACVWIGLSSMNESVSCIVI